MDATLTPHVKTFRVPRGYVDPAPAEWEAIRQTDIWEPAKSVPDSYLPTPSELLWEPPGPVMVGPLGNNVSKVTPPSLDDLKRGQTETENEKTRGRQYEARRKRYSLRDAAQEYTKSGNVTKCGRVRYEAWGPGSGGAVSVVKSPGQRARFTGLCHCASVWECPVCMYKICQDRSEELRELVGRHRAAGGGVYMWTSTLPHDAGDELQPMRHHIAEAWQKMQTGNAYKRLKAMVGIVGTVRALEVTNGPSGWHPHLHILFLTDKPLEDRATGVVGRDGQRFVQAMKRRWTRRVTARNKETGKAYRPPSHEHGVTFLPCHKDEYITKMGLADELTRGSWKKSREVAGYRTPIQILANIAAARDTKSEPSKRDVALWTEYADAMKGAKQLTWSRGLRRRYNLAPEQSDLELLEREENDASAVVMYTIADNVWDRYFRNNWRARCAVLVGADRDGWDGIQRVIDRLRGLEPVPF